MRSIVRRGAVVGAILVLCAYSGLPTWATCGGGGGGGMGGANPGGGSGGGEAQVYHVPWKVLATGASGSDSDLTIFWFPLSPEDARGSELWNSRYLTMSSANCVALSIVPGSNSPLRTKYSVASDAPLAVLASKDGTELGRAVTDGGKLRIETIEDLLRKEIDKREDLAKKSLDAAKEKLEQKDADGAASLYQQVWEQHCLLPSEGKKAAKALKKMGKPVPEAESSSLRETVPGFDEPHNTQMIRTMQAGLDAERGGKFAEARRLYTQAHGLDPSDPVATRYLAELYRHHTGEWEKARALFEQLLASGPDPISRAVALHGLGKMTIHDGDFKKGVALFEQSLAAYPLALTYRNLAVFWNSEKNADKAREFVRKAIELEPDDEYNQIFAATYLVQLGRAEEAAEIARRHEEALAASYNLAAIHAQLGNKERALEMLRRHFFVYEQFDAVRAKEMQEARDDIAFARYHKDPDFIALTALADADASSYHRKKS